ncbi:acyltransferase [Moorena producens JHB]|uniref:Acyltransferase n=1 Tax=Moorena producens (strain JHB) TaxID=1454205 RepID=A0A1D9G977_MOOP1|nr:acyltransferase [Moorena producens]AOY83930.1 acyltransferase [Moorena producens JHB]
MNFNDNKKYLYNISSNKEYLNSIHVLRGIAALLVVCEHIVGRSPYSTFNQYFGWLNNLGHYGVVAFFVISGFLLPFSLGEDYNLNKYGRFMLRRVVRIEPTYLGSIALSCVVIFVITRIAPNAEPWMPSVKQILSNIFYLVPFTNDTWILGVYWTLAIEFQFYVIIGLLHPGFRRLSQQSTLNISFISILFSLLVFASPWCEPLQLIKYSPYFALGILLAMQFRYKLPYPNLVLTLIAITIPAILSGLALSEWLIGLVTFFIILYWKPPSLSDSLLGRALLFGGTISYSWYVTHQLLASVGESVAKFISSQSSLPLRDILVNLVPVGVFVFSIIFAWLLYILIEKPTHKLARRIRYKASS